MVSTTMSTVPVVPGFEMLGQPSVTGGQPVAQVDSLSFDLIVSALLGVRSSQGRDAREPATDKQPVARGLKDEAPSDNPGPSPESHVQWLPVAGMVGSFQQPQPVSIPVAPDGASEMPVAVIPEVGMPARPMVNSQSESTIGAETAASVEASIDPQAALGVDLPVDPRVGQLDQEDPSRRATIADPRPTRAIPIALRAGPAENQDSPVPAMVSPAPRQTEPIPPMQEAARDGEQPGSADPLQVPSTSQERTREVLAAGPAELRRLDTDAVASRVRLDTDTGVTADVVSRVVEADQAPIDASARPAADAQVDPQPVEASGSQFASVLGEVTKTESAAHTQAASGSAELHTRVIEQVAREVRLHRFQDRSDLVVRLNPPELGSIRIRVSQDAAGLTSSIQTGTEQVRGLLQAHLPALMDALSTSGVKVDSVSVSFDAGHNGLAYDAQQGHGQDGHPGQPFMHSGRHAIQATNGLGTLSVPLPAHGSMSQAVGYSWLA